MSSSLIPYHTIVLPYHTIVLPYHTIFTVIATPASAAISTAAAAAVAAVRNDTRDVCAARCKYLLPMGGGHLHYAGETG